MNKLLSPNRLFLWGTFSRLTNQLSGQLLGAQEALPGPLLTLYNIINSKGNLADRAGLDNTQQMSVYIMITHVYSQ